MAIAVGAETKFMEYFSVGTGVNPGVGVWSAINRDGDVEAFTIGTDGTVYNYYPDPTSDTGYSAASLGIQATTIGVTANGDGNITVFASINLALYMLVQQPGQQQRWSAPKPLNYPQPSGGKTIAAIYPKLVGSTIYTALLIPAQSVSTGTAYGLVMGCFRNGLAPTFNLSRFKYPTLQCTWLGTTSQTLAFAFIDKVIITVAPDASSQSQLPVSATFTTLSVTAVTDRAANSQVYAILGDGNAYHLISTDGTYSWAQLTQTQNFRSISGGVTNSGTTHLLLISGSARLSHMIEDTTTQTGFAAPIPIMANTSALTITKNGDGQIDMFVAASSSLTHLFSEQESSNWQIEPVEVQQGSGVDVYSCYGSDITFRDELGTPLALTGVTIWTPEPAVLNIDGSVYFVGPDQKARVTTNVGGSLNVQQHTTNLSIPSLLLTVPTLMTSGEVVTIAQDAVVQHPLAGLTGPQLLSATTADGTQVLQDKYHTEQSADAIAQAVVTSMQLSLQVAACAPAATVIIPQPRPGLGTASSADLPALRRLIASSAKGVPSWRFHVGDDGQAVFQVLTPEQAAANLAALRCMTPSTLGFWDFVNDLGDLISGAAQGVLDIVDTVVHAVEDGIHAAITFVVDGTTHLFETVVKTVEQAFDLVEAVFAQVKVFFETIFQWLGFILDPADISRTARALSYLANQFFDFADGAVAGLQRKCDDLFQQLIGQMDAKLDSAIQAIGADSTIGGYARAHQPNDPQLSAAVSNNVLLNHFLGSPSSLQANSVALPAGPRDRSDWNDISAKLTQIAAGIQEDPGFVGVKQFFTSMGQSADNLFRSLLSTLLAAVKALADAILSGIRAAIDLVLKNVQDLIAWAKGLMTTEWDIPVLSAVFSHLFPGLPLTMLNLVVAIVAIPVTAIYKILLKATPFANDGAVAEFEQSFSAASMLAASGLGSAANQKAEGASSGFRLLPLPAPLQTFMGITGGALIFINGFTCAGVDAASKIDLTGSNLRRVIRCGRIVDAIALLALFPWFFDDEPNNNAAHWDTGLWFVWAGGFFIDLAFPYIDERYPELPDYTEAVTWCIFGVFYAVVATMGSQKVEEYLSAVPPICQLLGLEWVVEASDGTSLLIQAGMDIACLGAAGMLVIRESLPK